jgi:hypothetical protein
MLAYYNIYSASMIGRSSSKTAAASRINAITRKDALRNTYSRGSSSGEPPSLCRRGAMISVALTPETANPSYAAYNNSITKCSWLTIACTGSINLFEDEHQVELLQQMLNEDAFARYRVIQRERCISLNLDAVFDDDIFVKTGTS